MATSKDPGTLGIYGFRNRKDHTYDGLTIATNLAVHEPRVWDILGAAGKQSITVGDQFLEVLLGLACFRNELGNLDIFQADSISVFVAPADTR